MGHGFAVAVRLTSCASSAWYATLTASALCAVVRGRLESAAPRALAVDAREHCFCRSTRTRNCDRCCPQRDASVQAERGSAGGDQQSVPKSTNLAKTDRCSAAGRSLQRCWQLCVYACPAAYI